MVDLLKIKKLDKRACVPTYGSEGAACFDLYTITDGEVGAHSTGIFGTGISVEIPKGYAMLIYSRSGHGFKNGLRLVNSTGVIDSDYRGEIMVKLHNDSPLRYDVKQGERIAQAMLVPASQIGFDVVEELDDSARGDNGFGSTGF